MKAANPLRGKVGPMALEGLLSLPLYVFESTRSSAASADWSLLLLVR